ncbi:hypothetical protein BGX33_007508 [Mortierella sp. NVP41]|nr:hypothetical protein BGX33_007508 [Mortierella sp. NVP41]
MHPFSPSQDPFNPFGRFEQDPSETTSFSGMWALISDDNNNNHDHHHHHHTDHNDFAETNQSFLSQSLEDPFLSLSRCSSGMQPRRHSSFCDESLHTAKDDNATTTQFITPGARIQQPHPSLYVVRGAHGRSSSDASIASMQQQQHHQYQERRPSRTFYSEPLSIPSLLTVRRSSCLDKFPVNSPLPPSASNIKAATAPAVPGAAALPNYKTEYCTKFRETGKCPFGERCQFVHHENEFQRRGRALTYKTRPCWSGVDCQYQKNHSRCVYLHGDETAEMFDEQRGISFARVQKILVAKEVRQQHRRSQQQQQAQHGQQGQLVQQGLQNLWGPHGTERRHSLVRQSSSSSSLSSSWSESMVDAEQHDAQRRRQTYHPSTPPTSIKKNKPLTAIAPPLPSTTTTASHHLLEELLSPGLMPHIETPFPSHDRIHEWKDPCFDDEDDVRGIAKELMQGLPSHRTPSQPLSSLSPAPSSPMPLMEGGLGVMDFLSGIFATELLLSPTTTTGNAAQAGPTAATAGDFHT